LSSIDPAARRGTCDLEHRDSDAASHRRRKRYLHGAGMKKPIETVFVVAAALDPRSDPPDR
jgi:hypothetical protein